MRIVDDRGERVTGFGTKILKELTGGRFVTLGRSDMSRLLFEKIKGTTEVIFDDEIVGLQEYADCMQIQFRGAGERRFDVVIGADGLHSNVRRLVFGPQERFEKQLGYVVAAFEARGYRPRDEDVYVIYGEAGRMLGRFALHDNRTLFLFVFAADVDTAGAMLDLPAQKEMLRDRFGEGKWECYLRGAAQDRLRGADQNPRYRAGGDRSGIPAAWISVGREFQSQEEAVEVLGRLGRRALRSGGRHRCLHAGQSRLEGRFLGVVERGLHHCAALALQTLEHLICGDFTHEHE